MAGRRLSAFCALLLTSPTRTASPQVALIRTLWGLERFDDVEQWPALFKQLASANYSGVEAPTWVVCGTGPTFDVVHECDDARKAAFRNALTASGLFYVAQCHTAGYPIASGRVTDHLASLRSLLLLATELGARLANVHGGVDWWGHEDLLAFFHGARRIQEEEAAGVPVVVSHETHRMRALATPTATAVVLKEVAGVKLTADLSHWVVGAERLFNFPSDRSWWPTLLEAVAGATALTHARVGAPREIQVADPSAPEHAELLAAYEEWWEVLWASQATREGVVYVEAEFGPAPYMPVLPHTQQPLASLDAAVEFVGQRQRARLLAGVCRET